MTLLGWALAGTLLGPPTPEAAAQQLLTVYLKQDASVDHFDGVRALAPFLTRRLLRILGDAKACQRDWRRQQPKGSTDKPPFVDCCLLASSPEGIPTAFQLGSTESLSDHRYKVFVDFTYSERPGTYSDPKLPLETWSWRDAVIVASEGGRLLIDDFLFLRESPRVPPLVLSDSFTGCRGSRWIGAP